MPTFIAQQLRYGLSHIGKSLLWVAADLMTIYALVTIGAGASRDAGLLFLAGMAVNALADVAIGRWLDHHPGHERRVAATGLLAAATAFPLTMLVTPAGPGVLLAATLMFRIAYSAYDVPHNALLSRLAPTPSIAMRLSRLRTLGTGIAAGLVGLGLHHVSGRAGLAVLLLSVSIVAMASGALLFPLLRVDQAAATGADRNDDAVDGAFPVIFCVANIAGTVGLAMLAKAMFHLPPAASASSSTDAGIIIVLLTLGRTLAALLPLRLASGRAGMALLAVFYGLAAVATLPFVADPGRMGGPILPGLAMGATNLIAWATLPFVIRTPGGYGLYTMSIKLALGVAGLLMTAWLGSATALTSPGLRGLSVMSAAACIAAALLLWGTGRRPKRQRRSALPGIDAR